MTEHFIELRLGMLQFARGAIYLPLICVRLFRISSSGSEINRLSGTDEITLERLRLFNGNQTYAFLLGT